MSSCTWPSSLGVTTASWLATTVSTLEWVKSTSQVGTATSSQTSTNPSVPSTFDRALDESAETGGPATRC